MDDYNNNQPTYMPTEEEIAEETAKLRLAHIRKRVAEDRVSYPRSLGGKLCANPDRRR